MSNRGQILEDAVCKDLRKRFCNGKRFYLSVAENIKYKDDRGCEREIDDFAVHYLERKKFYIIIVECKMSDRRNKAIKQLMYSRRYLNLNYPQAKIFTFYAYNYKPKTGKYTMEWLTWEIDRCERKRFL